MLTIREGAPSFTGFPMDSQVSSIAPQSVMIPVPERGDGFPKKDELEVALGDRRHSLDDMVKQDGLLPLLATMNRLRLYDQADTFSALLGYTSYRYLRRNSPVEGRFS